MSTEHVVDGNKVSRQDFECGYCDVPCVAERNVATATVTITHEEPKCSEYLSLESGGITVVDYMKNFIERKQAKLKAKAEREGVKL